MILTHSEIDCAGQVRVWVETDAKPPELIMLKLGSAKALKIEDLKELDEKAIFATVDKMLADRETAAVAEKAAYPDKRIAEIDSTIATLTAEKQTLEASKPK